MSIIVLLVIGILIYANFNPSENQLFPKCPVYTLTGYQCPGCGFQRALYNFLHGNVVAAFSYNPLIFILFPYLFSIIVLEYFTNKTNPFVQKLHRIFLSKWALLIIATLIVIFMIVRNV